MLLPKKSTIKINDGVALLRKNSLMVDINNSTLIITETFNNDILKNVVVVSMNSTVEQKTT